MKIEMALTARRTALTLAIAGAVLGFAAPAASAAPMALDGPTYIIDGPGNGHGPAAFMVSVDNGREAVFFCDADKPNKRHNVCIDRVVPNGPRF